MTKEQIYEFIGEQKTAFISSVDADGFPITRAMLAPRVIKGNELYFSTNTSSSKVAQFLSNNKACVYFYKRGRFKYQGVTIKGTVEVCTDRPIKDMVWRLGDSLFYKQGKTDPDYCVLKFVGFQAEYYCDLKTNKIEL